MHLSVIVTPLSPGPQAYKGSAHLHSGICNHSGLAWRERNACASRQPFGIPAIQTGPENVRTRGPNRTATLHGSEAMCRPLLTVKKRHSQRWSCSIYCSAQLSENCRSNLQRRSIQDPITLRSRVGASAVSAKRVVAWQELDERRVNGTEAGR